MSAFQGLFSNDSNRERFVFALLNIQYASSIVKLSSSYYKRGMQI
ncbi:hypothetical protein [Bacillus sp. FSL K6-3431]